MNFRERLIDPNSPDRRPRRAAYALPALFTAGNLFLGFMAVLKAFEGAVYAAAGNYGFNPHWELAAKVIGISIFLDGLDGRIARLTNTSSDFGRELDSLADAISFGIAPAVLAYAWGFYFVDGGLTATAHRYLLQGGYFVVFLFLLCGVARLARFNITTNAVPRNPGRADRKYFVGLPIPAGAGMVVAVIYAANSEPIRWWPYAAGWLICITGLSFLMISTWRYRSFKDFSLVRPRSPFSVVLLGVLIYLVLNFSQAVLLVFASFYVGSGMVVRLGGILRRKFRHSPAVELNS